MRIASRLSLARASRASFVLPTLVACGALLTGCSDGNGDGNNGTGGSGGGGSSDTVMLIQENNFKADTGLTINPTQTAAGSDVQICWDKVTKDVQGHALTPKDIDDVSFIQVKSNSPAQVADLLNTGQLGANSIANDWEVLPPDDGSKTCAKLSEFQPVTPGGPTLNPQMDYKISSELTYLVVFATGTRLGYGARTMAILQPSNDSQITTLDAPSDSSSMLKFKADLHTLKHVEVPAGKPPRVDWSQVMTNGQGLPIGKSDVSNILVGFYKGKDVAALEAGFLNLELPTPDQGGPTQSWKVTIASGRAANLINAPGRMSEPPLTAFPTTDPGIWLMGMFCDACQNPAPVIVTILDPK